MFDKFITDFTLEQAVYQTLYEIAGTYDLGSPNRLRDVMARSNTVISGSWALLVIFQESFKANDLDLYTSGSDDTGSHILLSFLASQGYEVVTSMDTNYLWTSTTNLSTIRHIFKLAKPGQTGTINVIVSRTLSELHPIFEFHSTLVMNFIAWYGFVCLHSGLTLQGRGIINHYPIPDAIIPCIQKYATRGFDLRASLDVWAETYLHTCGRT